ncbi:hypothetical protein FACS1894110_10700 [Spirochaetia bacterium]|nr:hypothetical protein FACS1894110_10700 [Spirochaetia bacterium]
MDLNISTKSISAVICTWNCENTIGLVLDSVKANNIEEIIVVDADSEDKTFEIAKKYTDLIFHDPREGLAKARNIGISHATREYVINIGSDNIMPKDSIVKMLSYMANNGYSGVSAQTLLKDKDNYCSFAMNIYKQLRYYPGERNVIGTPTLFKTELLKNNPYDNKMSWSDDGDICTRLLKIGHKFAIADVIVYEIGSEKLSSVIARWKQYGKSDWETYSKYSPEWSFSRKIQSLLYPLKNELIFPLKKAKPVDKLKILPFLLLIVSIRYFSWIKWSFKK